MNEMEQYLLRYCAGVHWLIKVDQQASDYVPPLMINDVGAIIWNGMKEGKGLQELSILLHNQYGIDSKKAILDVEKFVEQLISQNIISKL